MELIEQIINDLIDTNTSVNAALLKTKFLASRLNNSELLSWVNNELEGYELRKDIPEYRKYQVIVEGDFIHGNKQYTKHPIPTIGLSDFWQDEIGHIRFQGGISALEGLIKSGNTLQVPFSAEVLGIIGDNFRSMAPQNGRINLYGCRQIISIHAVQEVLSFVRNKLLNFMLELDQQFGSKAKIEDLKNKPEVVNNIMTKTIIKAGDGSVITTGSGNTISANINIAKGDKNDLLKYLKEIGIGKEDALELISVIDEESPNQETQTFGQKVNTWLGKMVMKAASGAWSASTSAAGNLLATGIKAYYDWQ